MFSSQQAKLASSTIYTAGSQLLYFVLGRHFMNI